MKRVSLLFAFALGIAINGMAQDRPTHEIHAAMLYNFIKYVQWPNESDGGEFVVGVIGDENVFNTLKAWYDGKPKGTKKYVIKKLGSPMKQTAARWFTLEKQGTKILKRLRAP